MRTPADDPRYQPGNGRPRRPYPRSQEPSELPDSKVKKLHRMLHLSGVPDAVEELFAPLPGPPGYPIRLVLLGLVCASYEKASTNLDDAFEIISFGTSKRLRAELSIPTCDIEDQDAVNALYNRFHRAWSRMVRLLDPAPHQRRSRLPRADGRKVAALWNGATGEPALRRLEELANRLVTSPVRTAFTKGLMRHWRGDTAIDTTCVPTWARPHTRKRSALEASANWHYKGGGDREFGYSATLAIAAHADPDRAGRYPQLILGMVLHTPEKDMGRHAQYVSAVLAQLTELRGFTAADRAYTKLFPKDFHQPMRALGYMPVLDFAKTQVTPRAEGYHQGAIAKVGRLFCPRTPRRLLDLYQQIRSAKNERERIPLREQLQEIEPYALTRKDTLDERGTERFACPATKLNCPWAQERERLGTPKRQGPVPVTIHLDAPRARSAHPAARPSIDVPDIPLDDRPKCCRQSSVTVQAHVMPRMRQELPWQTPSWALAYQSLRAHIEGGNGRLKSVDTALHAREKRQPRGRVAQSLLAAITVMVENITELERFLIASKKSARTGLDLEAGEDLIPYPPAGETSTPAPHGVSRSP
ncbi:MULTISPECIES: hypothetical protein [unclassified Streptomyces]|uniref:hypothetical protein n=1 Tax=unclassified Streptomyces TaxID=2593676 RepID=UPI000DC79E61|nr:MULTISPECIES: hypothetical protein [unclassified Streptomyces]AWZ07126.1 hypothetical protein DRB89_23685 [Streptomyces sp. ICC4]AWZ14853.1 hypothetical protein DRB96_24235 [Streptomyces sp. ICC1]